MTEDSMGMQDKPGQLWGGRFRTAPHAVFAEFNDSLRIDKRLFVADVSASIAYANALHGAGALTDEEAEQIVDALTRMLEERSVTPGYLDNSTAEDVHSFIEGKLIEMIGDAGRKIHTGRSRNDQVTTAFRLWIRYEIDNIEDLLHKLQTAIVRLAERHASAVLPGYTHLQRAQPVLWAHWCLAYFEMFRRDRDRLAEVRERTNVLPLGSGALAGTTVPIDREAMARELGFDGVTANSIDGVSDRDFAVEFTAAASLIMAHLSRLAEDLILYCSAEFGFLNLSDEVSTGSSLLPQKKNPDALELIRGKTGRVYGNHMALLTLLKGLPLAYNKDLQEDKEAVFDTVDAVCGSLRIASLVLENASLDEQRARGAASAGYLNAAELSDHLVKRGVPFRTAHELVGRIVLHAIGGGRELHELSLDEIREIAPMAGDDVMDALGLDATLASKNTIGGTSPDRVKTALEEAHAYLAG